jgi:hypothetical protein
MQQQLKFELILIYNKATIDNKRNFYFFVTAAILNGRTVRHNFERDPHKDNPFLKHSLPMFSIRLDLASSYGS